MLIALQQGGFSISFRGRHAHNIAIDAAHEMAINKDCKEAITKPSADYTKRVATFLPVRFNSLKNLNAQLFPEAQSDGIDDILSLTCVTCDAISRQRTSKHKQQNLPLKATSQPNPKHL